MNKMKKAKKAITRSMYLYDAATDSAIAEKKAVNGRRMRYLWAQLERFDNVQRVFCEYPRFNPSRKYIISATRREDGVYEVAPYRVTK